MVFFCQACNTGLQIRVCTGKLFFLFLNQNICCGYSKEPSRWDGSFKHPKHMFKLMGKEIIAILGAQTILIWTYVKYINLIYNQASKKSVWLKIFLFLFLNQNICCWYSKEPSQWDDSFEHPKHKLKLMDKKILNFLCSKFCFFLPRIFDK